MIFADVRGQFIVFLCSTSEECRTSCINIFEDASYHTKIFGFPFIFKYVYFIQIFMFIKNPLELDATSSSRRVSEKYKNL